jgi:hypothetical protein
MSKAIAKSDIKKVLTFVTDANAYGYVEIEITQDALDKYGKVVSKCEPDVFAICINNITKKVRDIFEI